MTEPSYAARATLNPEIGQRRGDTSTTAPKTMIAVTEHIRTARADTVGASEDLAAPPSLSHTNAHAGGRN